ncbi:hypothetical protein ANAEL_05765 [Anaerolineales bacterium]|nr:hypothetical protein ANAEL_05765 [Anaerolineales bacterium]
MENYVGEESRIIHYVYIRIEINNFIGDYT